jgi:hypothetical protein
MTAVSDVPDVAWQKMAIRARHGVFLRVSGSWRCVLKVSAESQFPKRLERSEAVERLELLELASSFCQSGFFTEKPTLGL